MNMKTSHISLLSRLQAEINSDAIRLRYRRSANDFIRRRILTFSCLVYLRLNMMNKSISVELNKFLGRFQDVQVSKQAFSKAIKKIKWEGFAHFNNFFVQGFYQTGDYHKFKDQYLLVASDGTTFELPYVPALVAHFGQFDNGQMRHPICMASSVKFYDVLNRITICTSLSPYQLSSSKGNSEKALFEQRLAEFKTLVPPTEQETILIGDKYYPSFYYFHALPEAGLNFVFRCSATFCREVKAFAKTGAAQAILSIDMQEGTRKYKTTASRLNRKIRKVKVRCVRIDLANGKTMFLLTNLNQDQLSIEELARIYQLRWGEETSFDVDKNLLEIENFSSKSVNGVLQEFYAKTLTANIAAIVIEQAQQLLDEQQKHKNNKHQYKINQAVAIGLIKDEIVPLLNATQKAEDWMNKMVKLILPHRSPIRPNRSFPKKRKHKLKFSMNVRRVT